MFFNRCEVLKHLFCFVFLKYIFSINNKKTTFPGRMLYIKCWIITVMFRDTYFYQVLNMQNSDLSLVME